MTERLYYTDAHLTEFQARVTGLTERVSGWTGVRLDRTAFYPAGGGQPSDTGSLNGSPVVECLEDEDGGVLHFVQGRPPDVGGIVNGQIDWARRLDHIQQHTGQHILSQAFIKLHGAETRAFRILDNASEIDVALDEPSNERIDQPLELANQIIWEDRPVHTMQVDADEVTRIQLRKESKREGKLRLIEIEDFDVTPCGGTHANRTGEVGMIAVRSWERAKGLTRIRFVAGNRVLADYRRANGAARNIAALFSTNRDDAYAAVERLLDQHMHLRHRVRELEEITSHLEAQDLIKSAGPCGAGRIVLRIFDGRDLDSLKKLSREIISIGGMISLIASRDGDTARLIFARSTDAVGDMNILMREACLSLAGRGGGKADMAQGGGGNLEKLQDVMEAAAQKICEGVNAGAELKLEENEPS